MAEPKPGIAARDLIAGLGCGLLLAGCDALVTCVDDDRARLWAAAWAAALMLPHLGGCRAWDGSALDRKGGGGKAQSADGLDTRRVFATPHPPPFRSNPQGRGNSGRHLSLPARCVGSPHGLADA